MQVLAICSVQVPAGRRINFEGPAFGSKTILRQNTSDHAICQLCVPFPLNNSKILGKGPFKFFHRNETASGDLTSVEYPFIYNISMAQTAAVHWHAPFGIGGSRPRTPASLLISVRRPCLNGRTEMDGNYSLCCWKLRVELITTRADQGIDICRLQQIVERYRNEIAKYFFFVSLGNKGTLGTDD